METGKWYSWEDLTQEEQLIDSLHSAVSSCIVDINSNYCYNYSIKKLLQFITNKIEKYKHLLDCDFSHLGVICETKDWENRSMQWKIKKQYQPLLIYFKDEKWQDIRVFDIINKKINLNLYNKQVNDKRLLEMKKIDILNFLDIIYKTLFLNDSITIKETIERLEPCNLRSRNIFLSANNAARLFFLPTNIKSLTLNYLKLQNPDMLLKDCMQNLTKDCIK